MGCSDSDRNIVVPGNIITIPELFIYYGSQSGNSENFANKLLEEDQRKYKFKVTLKGLEDFNADDIQEQKLIIFVVSTYEDGGPTDNAKQFYKWLTETKANLSDLKFAIFGCGDSNYKEHFNTMAKTTEAKLLERGAIKIFETGLGDDINDLKGCFMSWKSNMWDTLITHYQINNETKAPLNYQKQSTYVSKLELVHESEQTIPIPISDYTMSAKLQLLSGNL